MTNPEALRSLFARAEELAAWDWPEPATADGVKRAALRALERAFDQLLPQLVDDPAELARAWRPLHEPPLLEALAALEQQNPEKAQAVRAQLFLFPDIARLSHYSVQQVLRRIDFDTLVYALKLPEFAAEVRILTNLSERKARLVSSEKELIGPTRVVDIYRARHTILMTMYELADRGQLRWAEEEAEQPDPDRLLSQALGSEEAAGPAADGETAEHPGWLRRAWGRIFAAMRRRSREMTQNEINDLCRTALRAGTDDKDGGTGN